MVAAIRGDAPPPVTLSDAIVGLEVIEAARASAGREAVIELGAG
jgi:hypothetical protein